jgi:hypothetical protein
MTRPFCRAFALALVAFTGCITHEARAQSTLGPASYQDIYNNGYHPGITPINLSSAGLLSNGDYSAVQSGLMTPLGQIIPYTSATLQGTTGEAGAYMIYQFEIVGSPGIVPVSVAGILRSNISSPNPIVSLPPASRYYGFSDAFVLIPSPGSSLNTKTGSLFYDQVESCLNPAMCPYTSDATNFRQAFSLNANTPYFIYIGAETDVGYVEDYKYSAMADPFVQIDPSFLDTNPGYSLEFSAGVDNVPLSETPLPPALPMFSAALLALGAFAWRRRKWPA